MEKEQYNSTKENLICITGQYEPVIPFKKRALLENMHSNCKFVNNEHSVPII